MKIAVHGLGRMGSQITQKLAETEDVTVVAHNRSPEPVDEAIQHGAIGAYTKEEVLDNFKNQRVILWLMLPAEIVDEQLDAWLAILPKDSIIIDGGNSDYRLSIERAKKVQDQGSSYFDIGVSGGVWGYRNGFSMMCGGKQEDFEIIKDFLIILSVPNGDFDYYGPSGSGHFVKMVHNAVEYGMMESLAEGYRLIKEGPIPNIDLAKVARVWQHGSVVNSWLNSLIEEIMTENPKLDNINGVVAESGEARWSIETAQKLAIPLPAIEVSFQKRIDSQNGDINYATKLLSAMRNKFGGHNLNN
jgi:6-phosphogluconate dehydrogenase